MYQTRITGGVAHQVDTVTIEVHSADSSEAVRRDFDAMAKRQVNRLREQAGTEHWLAQQAGKAADSVRQVLDTAMVSLNQLRMLAQRQDSLRLVQLALEQAASDSLRLALSHATERWQAADSAARAMNTALHDALTRLVLVAHQAHRCGLGAAGPVGLSQSGFGLGAAFGFSCRL